MRNVIQLRFVRSKNLLGMLMVFCSLLSLPYLAEGAQLFHATVVDTDGIESQIKNFRFYWEERLDDTSFVPHELHHVPVKNGASTINVQFSTIKEIHISSKGKVSELTIHLANGKTGKFPLSIKGSFRGDSDFGEADFPPSSIKTIILKKG